MGQNPERSSYRQPAKKCASARTNRCYLCPREYKSSVNTSQRGLVNFLASRWRGEVSFERLFWFDMLVVGTIVNLVAAALSLILFGLDAPAAVAVAVFFSPLPYNLFLFAVVWRAAGRAHSSWVLARLGAVAWLVFATLI